MSFAVPAVAQDPCRLIRILQDLFLCTFALLSSPFSGRRCVCSPVPRAELHLCASIPEWMCPHCPSPGSTRLGGSSSWFSLAPAQGSCFTGGLGQEPGFKIASAPMEKSIFSHKTRRGMDGIHSLNKRVSVLS